MHPYYPIPSLIQRRYYINSVFPHRIRIVYIYYLLWFMLYFAIISNIKCISLHIQMNMICKDFTFSLD